jgi:suppressor of ftsI
MLLASSVVGAQEVAAVHQPTAPSPARTDLCAPPLPTALYCIELFPTAATGDARGTVELHWAESPFAVAVTPDGRFVYDLNAVIEGLPAPETLGDFSAYVAWATPLEMAPVVRLGTVQNGMNALGTVEFNKFLVLISAEAAPDVTERAGPLVLRGRSPSGRLEPHDLLASGPAAEQAPPGALRDGGHDQHHDHGAHADGWPMPPMYPDLAMPAGEMAVRPRVGPLLPVPADTRVDDLPEVRPTQVVELPDGGTLDLVADYVRRRIGGQDLVMLAFNGMQPGPLLRVREASTIVINFRNETPFATAVHWHGIRLENRFDGVPHVTQEPVPPGGTFQYRVFFPDPGIYWYHPHHREDVQQELGLYGNMLVDAQAADYYGPANREAVLMVDDLLLGEDGLLPFGREAATHALMGRFGNVFLVNGEPDYTMNVDEGDVVRFMLTNASNTRTFNLSIVPVDGSQVDGGPVGASPFAASPVGASPVDASSGSATVAPVALKIIASDVSRFEREARVNSVVLSPAERYVVEVRFTAPGSYALVNRVQAIDHRQGVFFAENSRLGTITVGPDRAAVDHGVAFDELRFHDDVVTDIDQYRERFDDPPDYELVLSLETQDLAQPIIDAMLYDRVYAHPVEWAGTMPHMNWASSAQEVRWILRDAVSGRENDQIDWRFAKGDVVRIRIRNERDVFHAMQHTLHIHGQRFLVLSRNGRPNTNLVWKDTVLLPAGTTTEILLELSNPGLWMVHCHIAEHLEAGMQFVLEVEGI